MRFSVLDFVRAAATLLLGVFAGGVLFTLLAPSLRDLPGTAYVRQWQALNHDYGAAMPPLLLACLALLVVTCLLSRRRGRIVLGLSGLALLLVIGIIGLTVTQLEPLNRLADGWNPDQLPTDWADVRDRWWALHVARTAMAVVGFGALLWLPAVDLGSRPGGAADSVAAKPAAKLPQTA